MKRYVWNLLATIVDRNFKKEYAEASQVAVQESLTKLLFHAVNNVPYYQRVLRNTGVEKNGLLSLDNFVNIPILTKQIIRQRARELTSIDFQGRKWFYNHSGGSTGKPVQLIQDRLFLKWIDATWTLYFKDIIGIDENFEKKIILWGALGDIFGNPRELLARTVDNFLRNKVWLSAYRLNEYTMRKFVRIINSYKPAIIEGYAGSLYELARFIEEKKLYIHCPKIVVSQAEQLLPPAKEKIESIFGSEVYNFYGSREVDGMAGECKCGYLHMFTSNNYIEVLDRKDQPVREGEEGRIVVTTLHNFSMPLIRYDIGDMAILGPEKCKCGKPFPTLIRITGRQVEHFIKEDGELISGYYFYLIFMQETWIKAFSLIQEDYARIRIKIELSDSVPNQIRERMIDEKIERLMGKTCEIVWEVTDEIPKTRTGKYLFIQSKLKHPA